MKGARVMPLPAAELGEGRRVGAGSLTDDPRRPDREAHGGQHGVASATVARVMPASTSHASIAPPNVSPAPTVSTTSTAGTGTSSASSPRRTRTGPPASVTTTTGAATRTPGTPGRPCSASRCRRGRGCGPSARGTPAGRRSPRDGSSDRPPTARPSPSDPTSVSIVAAIGSNTRPSVPTCTASTPDGSAASSCRASSAGADVPTTSNRYCASPRSSSSANARVVGSVGALDEVERHAVGGERSGHRLARARRRTGRRPTRRGRRAVRSPARC